MSAKDDKNKQADLESEIRRHRQFSLAEAIGREAGNALKGASPVPRTRQVLMELKTLLANQLYDPEGSLRGTLEARLQDNLPLLDRHRQKPAGALLELLAEILSSPESLQAVVRDADARWGREYQERPLFNQPGQPARPDDPYSPDSVSAVLEELQDSLRDAP